MFGYVVVNKPELKIKEYDEYREYYCGLCYGLKHFHGVKSQLCLSYDYTFLLMLFTGLYEPEETCRARRCAIHPFEKRKVRDNKFVEYVADMGIVLARLKCVDDWDDEKDFVKKSYGAMLKKDYSKVKAQYPEKIEIIEQCIMNIRRAEENKETNIDVLSGYFGKAFEEVCAIYADEWETTLRSIGFFLGKFIYIMDAYDDIEKDIKDKNFNPFKEKYLEEGFDEYIREILMLNAAECAREFEKLPIIKEVEILRNILYSGIWTKYAAVYNRRKTNEKSV